LYPGDRASLNAILFNIQYYSAKALVNFPFLFHYSIKTPCALYIWYQSHFGSSSCYLHLQWPTEPVSTSLPTQLRNVKMPLPANTLTIPLSRPSSRRSPTCSAPCSLIVQPRKIHPSAVLTTAVNITLNDGMNVMTRRLVAWFGTRRTFNEFFNYYQTPLYQRVRMASFHMEGKALVWFQDADEVG